jgi:inositol 1,4,5-triphosphate receptor type 1
MTCAQEYDAVVEDPYADTGGEDTVALTGVENIYFPAMRDWIKEHIESAARKKVMASNMEENELLADIIEVLELLVKYGYYDDPGDVEDVLRPLLEVLNGFTDVPFSTEGLST